MPEMDTEPATPRDPGRSSAWEGPAIALGLLVVVAGAAWWLFRAPNSSSQVESGRSKFTKAAIDPNYSRYVGDLSCRECHAGEAAAHSRSGHSKTLRLASQVASARRLDGREVADPERSDVTWRFKTVDGQLWTERTESGETQDYLIEYVLGSRRHAATFVSLIDRDPASPRLLEHRLTDFAQGDHLDLTPGQKQTTQSPGNTPHGREHDAWNTLKCLGCHATILSDRGPAFLDEATMIPNVSCERCHGPAREHVEAARGGAIESKLGALPRLEESSAIEQMKQCGECHRTPEMVTPGEIKVDNAALVRHQPVGLMQSTCFLKSEGKLRCSTCHDPHARSSTDQAAYQARCLDCHARTDQKRCTVNPSDACISCHMPRRDVGRGMMMSDHWIRVIPATSR